jgi:hypothetical protein
VVELFPILLCILEALSSNLASTSASLNRPLLCSVTQENIALVHDGIFIKISFQSFMHQLPPEKILSQCHFANHKSHMTWPREEREPERRGAGD